MADIRELRRLTRQLEDQLVVCMRCGMCQAVCPVFAQTGRESDVARGKLVLLDGLIQAMLDDPQAVRERLQRCLLWNITGSACFCPRATAAAGSRPFPPGTPEPSTTWCATTWTNSIPPISMCWSPAAPPAPPRSKKSGRPYARRTSARARTLAARTMDIAQFLVQGVEPEAAAAPSANGRIVTFHDSCHLKKSLGVFSEPRELIRANPDYTLKEMAASDDCCGMGGSFNLEHYGLSGRIGGLKRDQIAAAGCSVVATGCPACMLQIADMLSQAGDRIAVKHPVEIYAESFSAR